MFKKITLENGLRVVLVPQKESLSTTVLVLVEAGSKYETKEINGISHFLEHMCFKGTQKRPHPADMAIELDGIGAHYNAFTGLEQTGYHIKARNEHLDKILDVVSDMYLNQKFEAAEIDKERGVIIEEINMVNDDPRRKIGDVFLELLYGDQPAGWDIAGRKEIIQKLTRDNLIDYRNQHYLSQSTVIVLAGAFDEQEAMGKIKHYFSGLPSSAKTSKIKTIEKQDGPVLTVYHKQTDQSHIVLGARAFDVFDERQYILEVLSDILGGGMSSRLFQKVREEMGAAYYVYASSDLYSDHGYFSVSAGVDNNRIEPVIRAILGELKKISSDYVPEEELQKVKDHLTGNLAIGLETSNALAGFYGGQEITLKKVLTPQEIMKKIQSVTAKQIKEVAQEIFQNNKLNLAVLGPFKDKEKFENIFKL